MAAAAPLGLGTWLSLSRGALAALAAGLVVLLAVAPAWPQLRAVGLRSWPGRWRRWWAASCGASSR